MNQATITFTVRAMVCQLDFANAIDDRQPKIAEDSERFAGHHRFVLHLPDHRQLGESAGAALAGHKPVAKTDQLEKTVLPGGDADLDVDPRIRFGRETIGSDSVGLSGTFLCATRNAGHHPSAATAADGESVFGQRTS